MGVFGGQSTGGWTTLMELHSAGLITSDYETTRPIARLAEYVPTLDDGSITILPDGRMRVTYQLRRNVTWQDGAPYTAHDLVFSPTFLNDLGLPVTLRENVRQVETLEAADDWTAVLTFARPYSLANQLGLRAFWPHPRHLLAEAYERYIVSGNVDEVVNLPYWTSAYVHLGPFRVVNFDPGEDGILQHESDGRRFRNTISTVATGRLWEVATYADAWRRIGLEVEELQVPAAQARSLEYRASYPSWEATSSGQGDSILGRLTGPAARAENRWAGNRGGYEEPATQRLIGQYFSVIREREQFDTIRELSELIVTELPMLIFYYSRHTIGARKGVRALDDIAGGQQSSRPYGTYSRNAHLWDLE